MNQASIRAFVPLFIFGGLFVILSASHACELMEATQEGSDAIHWPTVPGSVTESSIKEHESTGPRGGKQTSYEPAVSYTYSVDGKAFTGHQIRFAQLITGNPADARMALGPYPVGAAVTVHYRADSPEISTLEVGGPVHRAWVRALAPGGFGVIVWILGALFVWRISSTSYRRRNTN